VQGLHWIVGISKPQREDWAALNIQRQGFDAYIPKFTEEVVRKQQVTTRTCCLFPRYVFVRTDGHWYFLLSTFGMQGVVLKGEIPAVMPDDEIEKLRERENSMGLITLPPKPEPARFARGQRLKVTYGPMSGLSGICQGDNAKERVRVLLQFLGRKSSALIARDALIAA
jgi:transcriptional antiterminator RfaH